MSRKVWTRQPQVRTGLAAPYRYPHAIAGIARDTPIGGAYATGGISTLSNGAAGRSVTWAGSGAGDTVTAPSYSNTSTFTILALVEFSNSGTIAAIVDRDLNTFRSFQFRRTASNTLELIRFNTAVSSVVSAITTGTMAADRPVAVAAVVDGLNHAVYILGEKASNSITGTPQVFDGVLGVGSSWGGTGTLANNTINGKVYAYEVIPRVLSDAQVKEFLQNPWGLFANTLPRATLFAPPASGTTYAVSLTEAAAASDAVSTVLARVGALDEPATGTDTFSALAEFVAALTEPASSSDVFSSLAVFESALAEAASATDAFTGERTLSATLSDAASATDTVAAALVLNGALTETATATDLVSSLAVLVGALSEATSATDTINWGSAFYNVTLSEVASAGDTISSGANLIATLTEAATSVDSISALMAMGATLTESSPAIDIVTGLVMMGATLSEPGSATDLWSASGASIYAVSLAEAAIAADLWSATVPGGVLSAPPIGHGLVMGRRTPPTLARRRANLSTRTR